MKVRRYDRILPVIARVKRQAVAAVASDYDYAESMVSARVGRSEVFAVAQRVGNVVTLMVRAPGRCEMSSR